MKSKIKKKDINQKPLFLKCLFILKFLVYWLRWLLFIPISLFATFFAYDLFTSKYTEIVNPELFKYDSLMSLIPGITPPNQSGYWQYQILAGIIIGVLWIVIGTLVAPKKKFVVSWILFILPNIFLIKNSLPKFNIINSREGQYFFIFNPAVNFYFLISFVTSILTICCLHFKKMMLLMKSKYGEAIRFGLVLTTILLFSLFFYNKISTKLDFVTNKKMEKEAEISSDRVALDMNGDGRYEMFVNPKMVKDYEEATRSAEPVLKLYDDDGDVLATTPDWFGFAPDSSHMDFVSPPKGAYGLNDLIQIDVTAGPHQTETMFLKLKGKELLPICKTDKPEGINDCLFYNSSGELGVEAGLLGGLGEDNRLAIIEYEDEYLPSKTKLDNKTIKIINETFKEKSDMAKLIAAMVKVDRERQVAWNIYIYNGKYFEAQSGENYDKYFNELEKNAGRKFEITDILEPILTKRSEMSEESVKYVEFIKNFWTKEDGVK